MKKWNRFDKNETPWNRLGRETVENPLSARYCNLTNRWKQCISSRVSSMIHFLKHLSKTTRQEYAETSCSYWHDNAELHVRIESRLVGSLVLSLTPVIWPHALVVAHLKGIEKSRYVDISKVGLLAERGKEIWRSVKTKEAHSQKRESKRGR